MGYIARMAGRLANRLARETSPYLLQHAHNPVDWYPWGPDALARARTADLPIFRDVLFLPPDHVSYLLNHPQPEDGAVLAPQR